MSKYTEEKLQKIWEKGKIVSGYDPNVYRKDVCNAWMKRDEHGNPNSIVGWEVDHIIPESEGGSSELHNLRPMQWENNREKSNNYPKFNCAVKSDGNKNVRVNS